jgi:hypothetical protein
MVKKVKIFKIWMWVVSLFVSLAIAGLFTNGQTITAPLISIFPQPVHTIIGWFIVISVVIGAVMDLMK